MANNASLIKKGDVIWVPYRKSPMWPALVQNVYPKKLTYYFFPLPNPMDTRAPKFSCHPKVAYAFCKTDVVPPEADDELKIAFKAALDFMNIRGLKRGSAIKGKYEIDEPSEVMENGKGSMSNQSTSSPTSSKENYEKQNESPRKKLNDKRKRGIDDDELIKKQRMENVPECSRSPAASDRLSSESTSSPTIDEMSSNKEKEMSADVRSRSSSVSTEKSSKGLMNVINENIDGVFDSLWNGNRVKLYKKPKNEGINITICTNNLLTDDDVGDLFDRIVRMVQKRDPSYSLIHSIHITCTVLLPQVIVICYAKYKSIAYEQALQIFNRKPKTKILSNGPVNGGLEELCRIACKERESLSE